MVGGVAEYEFIQQSGRESRRQAGQHADARSGKGCLDGGEAGGIGPQRNLLHGIPRVVDVVETDTFLVGNVVVEPQQFLAPVGGLGSDLVERSLPGNEGIGEGSSRRRYQGQQGVYVGVAGTNRDLVSWIRSICVWIYRAISWTQVANVGEISAALRNGRHKLVEGIGETVAAPLLRPEKEGLGFALVINSRDVRGAANGVAKVIFVVGRSDAVLQERGRIEHVVAHKFVGVAVEFVGSRFRLDFDGAGTVLAILCAVVGG